MWNWSWLVVLTGFIQYRLYDSTYLNKKPEQELEDEFAFFLRHPYLARFLMIFSRIVQMSVPWLCYTIFIIIGIFNEKSMINLLLLFTTLLLLFWHVTSDMVQAISHKRIIIGWSVYIVVATICVICMLTSELVQMPIVVQWIDLSNFLSDN